MGTIWTIDYFLTQVIHVHCRKNNLQTRNKIVLIPPVSTIAYVADYFSLCFYVCNYSFNLKMGLYYAYYSVTLCS